MIKGCPLMAEEKNKLILNELARDKSIGAIHAKRNELTWE